jgi:hypothetical protein
MTRILDIADLFTSASEPTKEGATASEVESFANLGAYEAAYTAVAGSIFYNTTTHRINYYDVNTTSWKVLTSDTVLGVHEALTAAHGATGAVVGTANTQTLTNKTIDYNSNTITNLPSSSVPLLSIASKTTTYTAQTTDDVLLCDSSGGAFTITLYTAVGNTGRVIVINKTEASGGAVTIEGDGAETVGGNANRVLRFKDDSLRLCADGANWQILSSNRTATDESLICSDCIGLGSGNLAVPYFGTQTLNTISKYGTITYNDSTNGAIFTATAPCKIYFNHRNCSTSIANIGIVKNASAGDLDLDVQSITESKVVAMDRQSDANTQGQCSFEGVLAIGDVIAPIFGPSESPYTIAQTQGLTILVSALKDFS